MVNQLVTDDPPPIGHNQPPEPIALLRSALADRYYPEIEKAGPIADRANKAPEKIDTDEDLALWTDIGVDAGTLLKKLDSARLDEKRPLEALIREIFEPAIKRLDRIKAAAVEKATAYNRAKAAAARAKQEAEERRLREEAEAKAEEARIAAEFGDVEGTIAASAEVIAAQQQAAEVAASAPSAADATRVRTESGALVTTRTEWSFEVEDYGKVDLNALRQFIPPAAIDKAIRAVVKIQKGQTKIEGVRVFQEDKAQLRRA